MNFAKFFLALNIFFDISKNEDSKILLIDLTDFLINKFDEKKIIFRIQ